MDDTGLVHIRQCIGKRQYRQKNRPPGLAAQILEAAPIDVLHRYEMDTGLVMAGIHPQDVGMMQTTRLVTLCLQQVDKTLL